MARITVHHSHGPCIPSPALQKIEVGYIGEAAERLARFEDMAEEIAAQQKTLEAEMEPLRAQGKTKSARFRELMGRKLMNQNLLILLQTRDLI